MKTILHILLLTVLTTVACAQTTGEWLRQKQTQEKYLVQQIAALQAYAGTLRQGYVLAKQGLSTVQHIRNGDLGLHQVFFNSLRQVHPLVRNSSPAQETLRFQTAILEAFASHLPRLQRSELLTDSERAYLQQVYTAVLAACTADMATFGLVLTPGKMEMQDASRLEQLEALCLHYRERYQFTRSFLGQAWLLVAQRSRQQQDTRATGSLHNIHPFNAPDR